MAKRQKDLKDWQVLLEEPESLSELPAPATPTRRTRRGASTSNDSIKLQRQQDGLTIQVGDCILTASKGGESYISIISSIQLGVVDFVEMKVVRFAKTEDVSKEQLVEKSKEDLKENELFITPDQHNINVCDVIEKVQVLSISEFDQVVLDESSSTSLYVCRRGCDAYGEQFSQDLDFKEWRHLFVKNPHDAILHIAESTLLVVSPTKRKQPSGNSIKEKLLRLQSPSRKSYVEESSSEDSDSDDYVDGDDKEAAENGEEEQRESEEEDEDEDDIANTEAAPRTPTKKGSPRKSTLRTPKSDSPSKRRRTQRNSSSVQRLQQVLSPLKKGFKVKSGSRATQLPSLSAGSPKTKRGEAPELSTASEAFLKLKEKLHASTKLASLPCRDDEFTSVYMNIESAIQEETGCCIYVSGTPGVGKTATIREVIKTLQELMGDAVNPFEFLEINCLKLLAANSAYEKLWDFISGIKVTPSNAALLLEDYFKRGDTTDRKPLVVLMDEIDQAFTRSQDVMYNFFNWPTYPNSKLIIIAVANTMDLPERMLTNKISSRIGLRRIQFVGYTFQELEVIIKNRLSMLSEKNRRKVTIGQDAVGYAARKVASVSGDARRALAICRRAVEIAELDFTANFTEDSKVPESEQTVTIKIEHINKAINEMVNSPLSQFLSSLSFASKLILVGVLLRSRRMGFAENPLGDVMDEMKNSLALLTSKESAEALKEISPGLSYADFLYGQPRNLRIYGMARLVNELVEFGVLAQQNIRSERFRTVSLNVSEEDVASVLKRDPNIAAMLG